MPGTDFGQEISSPPLSRMSKAGPLALLDADHFMLGPTLGDRFPDIADYQFAAARTLAGEFPGKIIPVTNRPVPVAAQLAETVGAGLACAESGATFFVCGHAELNPKYIAYREQLRPEVMKLVHQQIAKLELQKQIKELEGNLITACFYPTGSGVSMERFNAAVLENLEKEGLAEELAVHANERLDIFPKTLNKEQALLALVNGLYEFVYRRQIPWDMVIVGDDSKSAIPFMQKTLELSRGKASLITVANADPELKAFVAENDGYVSSLLFANGVRDCLKYAVGRFHIKRKSGEWMIMTAAK